MLMQASCLSIKFAVVMLPPPDSRFHYLLNYAKAISCATKSDLWELQIKSFEYRWRKSLHSNIMVHNSTIVISRHVPFLGLCLQKVRVRCCTGDCFQEFFIEKPT